MEYVCPGGGMVIFLRFQSPERVLWQKATMPSQVVFRG